MAEKLPAPASMPNVWCARHADGSISVSEEEWRAEMWRDLHLEVFAMVPEARALAAEAALAELKKNILHADSTLDDDHKLADWFNEFAAAIRAQGE